MSINEIKLNSSLFQDLEEDTIKDIKVDLDKIFFNNTITEDSEFETTINSKTIFSYDAIGLNAMSGRFVYNFFVNNERVNDDFISPTFIVSEETKQDAEFIARSEKFPRYNLINWKLPESLSINPNSDAVINFKNFIENVENFEKIKNGIRQQNKGKYFSSIYLNDSEVEISMYNLLSGSLSLLNIENSNNSQRTAAELLSDITDPSGGLSGTGKKFLIELMSNSRPEGLTMSSTDISKESFKYLKINQSVSNLSFDLKLNNLFIDDVFKYSSNFHNSVYQNEIKYIQNFANITQKNALLALPDSPMTINEDEFTNKIDAVEIINSNALIDFENYENKSEVVGYLVVKIEHFENGASETISQKIISDPSKNNFFDIQVRYGGVYEYNVYVIHQIIAPIMVFSDIPIFDNIKLAKHYMLSKPKRKIIRCVETVPPKAPDVLKVLFDYRRKLPHLHWHMPVNKQRDIKKFQIFKRMSVNEPFTVIHEYDFNTQSPDQIPNSTEKCLDKNITKLSIAKKDFIDKNYEIDTKPIYAIGTVDAHGLSSNLGTQIMFSYNKYSNKIKNTLISKTEAPKPYPNIFIEKDTFLDIIKTSGMSRMHVFFDPEYYRVFKYQIDNISELAYNDENDILAEEKDLELIKADPGKSTYTINIINIDNSKTENVDIQILDNTNDEGVASLNSLN